MKLRPRPLARIKTVVYRTTERFTCGHLPYSLPVVRRGDVLFISLWPLVVSRIKLLHKRRSLSVQRSRADGARQSA